MAIQAALFIIVQTCILFVGSVTTLVVIYWTGCIV